MAKTDAAPGPDVTISYGDGGVERAGSFVQREQNRIDGDLFLDYDNRKRSLKPPEGLKDDFLAPVKTAESVLNDVRKLALGKQEADGSLERGAMSRDMHDTQVRRIREAAATAIDQGAGTIPKAGPRVEAADGRPCGPLNRGPVPEAESVKADLRDAFRGDIDVTAFVERFRRADPTERKLMLSRWGQDFVTARGMEDLWDDIRTQCIDVAVSDPDAFPEGTRLALAGYAQADDVEATATMALNMAAMEADRL